MKNLFYYKAKLVRLIFRNNVNDMLKLAYNIITAYMKYQDNAKDMKLGFSKGNEYTECIRITKIE